MNKYNKVVIKVGSNVLSDLEAGIDTKIIESLVQQIAFLRENSIDIILVSSGAVASGRNLVQLNSKLDTVAKRQVLASVGQVKLLQKYEHFFSINQILIAQVLVTKEDFRQNKNGHYFNMRNCFEALLQHRILPIVNENDVVSVSELMFTDNDELAGLIATMLNADALIILSNVNGIYDGDPKLPTSKIISVIDDKNADFKGIVSAEKSEFGRGGMITKSSIARKVAKSGIAVHIANGKEIDILKKIIFEPKGNFGTYFVPTKHASNTKKRIAFSDTKGKIIINDGAALAITQQQAKSLLAVGIIGVENEFIAGDIVQIVTQNNVLIGIGKVQFSSKKILEIKGTKGMKPVVHYDFLTIV